MEERNPPDAEFKTLVTRVLQEHRGRAGELSERVRQRDGKHKNGDGNIKRASRKLRIQVLK